MGCQKAVAEKTNVFFYLFEKIKALFKNPLRVFNIINIVYTIYVPSLINQKRVQRIGLSKVKMSSPQLFTAKSFDRNKENGPKRLNFLNVLIHSQCNLFTLNIHQNTWNFNETLVIIFVAKKTSPLRGRQLRKPYLFLVARFIGLALRDKQKTLGMSRKLMHCGRSISIRPSWTLCPVLSCHLVSSDPRFTLNNTGFFTASPFVFSATGPHQIIAKFRVHWKGIIKYILIWQLIIKNSFAVMKERF